MQTTQRNNEPRRGEGSSEPPLYKPRLVGFYSRSESRAYTRDLSILKYMTVGDLDELRGVDLSADAERLDEGTTRGRASAVGIYDFYLDHLELLREYSGHRMKDVGFITSRRHIVNIINAKNVNSRNGELKWLAILLCGSVYLVSAQKKQSIDETNRPFVWSHKFFQHMLSDSPRSLPDPQRPVGVSGKFLGMYDLRLKENKILYKSIIDGIYSATDENDNQNVIESEEEKQILEELRKRKFVKVSSTYMKHDTSFNFRRFKTEELWSLGFLSGAEKIYLGFKDGNILTRVSEYDLSRLLQISHGWCPDDIFQFLDNTLNIIKSRFEVELEKLNYSGDVRKAPVISLLFEGTHTSLVECKGVSEHSFSEEFMEEIQKYF